MNECPLTEGCIFFNDKMKQMPSMSSIYKQRYCNGDMTQCARYRVFKEIGRENVPADLYPNDTARVPLIIEEFEGSG